MAWSLQKTAMKNELWNVVNINKIVNSESCFVNNEHQNMSFQKTQKNELLDSFTQPKPSSSTPSRSCSQKSTYWLYIFWPLHRRFCCSCFRLVEIPVMLKSISSKGCHPLQIAQNEDPREQSPARTNRTKTDWTSGTDEHVIVSLGYSIVGWKTHFFLMILPAKLHVKVPRCFYDFSILAPMLIYRRYGDTGYAELPEGSYW